MLKKLDASNNNLADLEFVERLTALKELLVEGNPNIDVSN